jgi:hypothetical protein
LISRLKTLLKPSRLSMVLILLKSTNVTQSSSPPPPSSPYKRRRPPLPLTAPPPPRFPRSLSMSTAAAKLLLHCCLVAIARPPHPHPSPGEAQNRTLMLRPPFSTPAGELSYPGTAGGPTLSSAPLRPSALLSVPPSVHGGPCDSVMVNHMWT